MRIFCFLILELCNGERKIKTYHRVQNGVDEPSTSTVRSLDLSLFHRSKAIHEIRDEKQHTLLANYSEQAGGRSRPGRAQRYFNLKVRTIFREYFKPFCPLKVLDSQLSQYSRKVKLYCKYYFFCRNVLQVAM